MRHPLPAPLPSSLSSPELSYSVLHRIAELKQEQTTYLSQTSHWYIIRLSFANRCNRKKFVEFCEYLCCWNQRVGFDKTLFTFPAQTHRQIYTGLPYHDDLEWFSGSQNEKHKYKLAYLQLDVVCFCALTVAHGHRRAPVLNATSRW